MLSHLVKFAVESAFSDQSKFYVDDDDDCEEEEELLFCKNNVCVHSSLEQDKIPGYFTIKSRTRKNGHIRLVVSWTPNSQLMQIRENTESKSSVNDIKEHPTLEVFSVDLSEMKTLKLFYDENDTSCGHFIIGNHENHYKVLHFHCGGMDKITKILEEWDWCVGQKISGDRKRRRCFLVTRRVPVKEDCYVEEGRFDPMPYDVWKTLFNDAGQIEDVTNFRRAVFFGGLSPEVRKEAWKFLLFYYAFNSTYEERMHWKSKKEYEYLEFHRKRLCMSEEEQDQFWKSVQCTVDKDVPRTDRSHPYFAGNDNPNTEIMSNILLNYAIHNPAVGYNQGMSDLLAPVLAVVQDEVDAFWCFAGLMEASVFVTSPKDDVMDRQLVYLRELVKLLEPRFYAHLLIKEGGLDMLFCHRWLLLCFKREFFNAEVLLMWEACWSRYQTEYFHIFLCVSMIQEYGEEVIQGDMQSDDMLQYFTDLSMKMDGSKVLRKARQLLLKFRQLPFIPCSLRGLLSGPGIWDSAPLPSIECHCHGLCSSTRKNSGSLTDSDVDIMMKSKGKVDLVKDEKPENEESPKEELSSSTNNYSNSIKDDVNRTANEESGTDRKKNENEESPKEELSSSTNNYSNSIKDDVNRTANEESGTDRKKNENEESPEEKSSSSTNDHSGCNTDDDVNLTANEQSEPKSEKPENEESPKEASSSSTNKHSSCKTDALGNRTENSESELGREEKPENQQTPKEKLQSSSSNESSILVESDMKNEDGTKLIIEEKSEIEGIPKEESSSTSSSKRLSSISGIDDNVMGTQYTSDMDYSTDTDFSKGETAENQVVEDFNPSNSKQICSITTGEKPKTLGVALEERPGKGTENGSSDEDYMGNTTNTKEISENNTEQDTMEKKAKTLDSNIKHVSKDLISESSITSVNETEGMTELASEAINDCQS